MKVRVILLIVILLVPLTYSQSVGFDASLEITAAPTCFDGFQNQGETGVDCGGPCPACPSPPPSNGGGGGGGGASTAAPAGVEGDFFSKYYFYLKANETRTILINVSGLAVYQIEIHFLNEMRNITIEVENKDNDLPIFGQRVSNYNYQYFKISGINVNPEDIDYVKMWYRVSQDWVKVG